MNAYGNLKADGKPKGLVDKIGPRVKMTAVETPATVSNFAAMGGVSNTLVTYSATTPQTIKVEFSEKMNKTVDLYGGLYATSICNPANYTIPYYEGSSVGTPSSLQAKISKITCTDTSATISLVKGFVGDVDYDAATDEVEAKTTDGGIINNLWPTAALGTLQLNGFTLAPSTLKQSGKDTDLTSGTVFALHYISSSLKRHFDAESTDPETDEYYTADGELEVKVVWLITDTDPSDTVASTATDAPNKFETAADVTSEGAISKAGSVLNPALYTIPSGYVIKSIEHADASEITYNNDKGQSIVVTLKLVEEMDADNKDKYEAGTKKITRKGTVKNFIDQNKVIIVKEYGDLTISVANVTDASGNVIDTSDEDRAKLKWTFADELTLDEKNSEGKDIKAGFHSLRRDR